MSNQTVYSSAQAAPTSSETIHEKLSEVNKMVIKRFNTDFGNSTHMSLINGFYVEMVTNVVEIGEEKAEGYFVSNVETAEELYSSLLISTEIDSKTKYYLVGDAAEKETLGNNHIKKIHDKLTSSIPYITFLAACAYYYELKKSEYGITETAGHECEIDIQYFSTMLPIWLLKSRGTKFSDVQNLMASRFSGEHKFNVLTPGMNKTFKVTVEKSTCRNEGEVGRWALKKTFSLEDNPYAEQFMKNDTVLVDLGGGTIDAALLPAGLLAPRNRDDLQSIEDIPYLAHLEKLRKEKLVEHFSTVRELEDFIVENIHKNKMERKDGLSGTTIDFKEIIMKSLNEYAKIAVEKVEDAFPTPKDKEYKYCYIGGVAEVIDTGIQKAIEEKYSREILERNHVFPAEGRKFNLIALEILSIKDTEALA